LAFAILAVDIILKNSICDANSFVAFAQAVRVGRCPNSSVAAVILISRGGIMPHRTQQNARHGWLGANCIDPAENAKNRLRSGRASVTMCHRNPVVTGISSPNFT
jgi:hypothetical protein